MRKKITIIILVCLITTTVGVGLVLTKKVEAQIPGSIIQTIELKSLSQIEVSIWEKLQLYLTQAASIAYKNSLRYFLNKVAYDTATHIATGSPGQKPLFITKNMGAYLQEIGEDAVASSFIEVGDMWGKNMCQPLNPLVQVQLTVSAKRTYEPKKPKCDWNTIRKNITDLRQMSFNDLAIFSAQFNPNSNDLGAYLTIRTKTKADQAIRKETEILNRIIRGEYEPITNLISGDIKTPAALVKDTHENILPLSLESYTTFTGSAVADSIGVFTNTLTAKLLERIFKKGFNPQADRGALSLSDFWTLGGTIQAARLFFGELAEPQYNFNVGIRLTNELVVQGEGQFNDVIDDNFAHAIDQKCTVGQAIGFYTPGDDAFKAECAGLISGQDYFGYNQDGVPDGLEYRSILVLRKFRIVPVGWELAAEYYKNFEVTGLNNTDVVPRLNLGRLVGDYDNPNSPYYKLVDPGWLLKAPATRCVREGAGPVKIEQEPYCLNPKADDSCDSEDLFYPFQRTDYCADYETCLDDDEDGNCDANDWGYCVEEEPIWRIDGTECSKKYYASCQTLQNEATGRNVNYLLNTLSGYSDGVCDLSNSGCREYCTDLVEPFMDNNYTCVFGDDTNKINLTSASEECREQDEGCHNFFSSYTKDSIEVTDAFSNNAVDPNAYGLLDDGYYKLAPGYYSCDGYTVPVSGVPDQASCVAPNFWRDDINVCVQSGTDECANFIKHCEVTDMGCKLYTPISNNDPAVPAVITPKDCSATATGDCSDETDPAITWNDECPASCVGYKTYRQMDTQFETITIDDEFIASTAQSCSEPGCDQFTNLDEVARGGEGIEYYTYLRQCIKPGAGGWETYYTWEGSDTTGYQLKKWELQSPGANSDPVGTSCTDLTIEDCREFFDQDLGSHLILYSTTIVVSDDCHPMRRSLDNIVYNGIPSESRSCSASNNMCREYKSNQGYNYQKIIESYFGTPTDDGGWTGGNVSNESVRRGDYSLSGATISHPLTIGDLEQGRIYTLEFLARGSGSVSFRFTGGDQTVISNSAGINDEWNFYSLTLPDARPTGLTLIPNETNNTNIEIFGGSFYIDNIVLKKMQSTLIIKDSWTTPLECDIPTLQINCEAYQDSDNNNINLKSFDHLCFEDVVGCELVIDSQNTITMSDDLTDYLVLDRNLACNQDAKGCTRLGLITPNRDNETAYAFDDKYKVVDPDRAFEQVCLDTEIFCQTYVGEQDIPHYFKDPLDRVCEYKKVSDIWGWYIAGTGNPCTSCVLSGGVWYLDDGTFSNACPTPPTNSTGFVNAQYTRHCIGGRSQAIDNSCTNNTDCTDLANPDATEGLCVDWVGQCDSNSSGCREYQDPQEPVGCDKTLRNYDQNVGIDEIICNYYYYKDVEECAQGVNPSGGCVGFWQTNDPTQDIRSYKVCENNTTQACEDDFECGGNRCIYSNAP